jgi:hypothetical protein
VLLNPVLISYKATENKYSTRADKMSMGLLSNPKKIEDIVVEKRPEESMCRGHVVGEDKLCHTAGSVGNEVAIMEGRIVQEGGRLKAVNFALNQCMTPTQKLDDLQNPGVETPKATTPTNLSRQEQQQQQEEDDDEVRLMNVDDLSKTHHLLKHWLSDGQRTAALAHFGTQDVKEAAKDVTKMGQRELQQKFKLVYGTVTHSNNNEWLRRKLYEAIGAAPVKLPSKSRAKKATVRNKRPKAKDRHDFLGQPMIKTERRTRRVSSRLKDGYSTFVGRSPAKTVARTASLPATPVAGHSVIDMHRYIAMDYFTTSASDDDTGSGMYADKERFHQGIQRGRSLGSSYQTDGTGDWNPFDSYDSTCFDGPNSLPILLHDDAGEFDLLFSERKMSSAPLMPIDDDDDVVLLPVDRSACNLVEVLEEFL